MAKEDQALIEACLNGSQRAWDSLVEQYSRLVYSIPRRYQLSDADSDDVFQAVFLQLYRQLAALRDQTRLSSWLITTTHRECWRVSRREHPLNDLDPAWSDRDAPDPQATAAWEEQHLVRQALTELGGRCEQLLTALFLDPEHPDYEEIARRLSIAVGSIGPSRARCFEKLERILRKLGF